MAETVQITDVVSRGLGRLLEQYKDLPNINKVLTIYLRQIQLLENVIYDTFVKRYLANAEGAQLDVIGSLVGEERQDKIDSLYRIWIAVRIRLNRSLGKPEDVIDCIQLATDANFELREYVSASFAIIFSVPPELPNDINAICHLAKAAGVRIRLLFPPDTDAGFRFKNRGDASNPDNGFGDRT